MQSIQYLTECDLKGIENNSFKVPRFLFSGTYKKNQCRKQTSICLDS
jgi:hypothetical protein